MRQGCLLWPLRAMNILLINPPCGPRTIGLKFLAKIEPLNLELIGAGVGGNNDVRLVDMEVRQSDLTEMLAHFTPDIVGITSEIVHVETALDALAEVRQAAPGCLTVVGGHHPTLCPQDFDDPLVDLIVIGEGVATFREIVTTREAGKNDYRNINGMMIRVQGALVPTAPRPLPRDLNDQPMPDRSLTARYRSDYFYLFEDSVAAVRTSTGCSFPCIFCSCRVYSQGKFIPRAPELVFEEIRNLSEDFIMFCDDHSFHDPERMRQLGQMLLDEGIEKRYFAYARTDSIVADRDVFELWARAGLSLVMTGLEAIDEERLKLTGKRTDLATNDEALRILDDLGIGVSAGFLVEADFTKRDFDQIRQYIKDRPAITLAEFTPLTPFPGTPLHQRVADQILTEDRQLYDLQHFVLPTDLPPKELHRLMMRLYRQLLFRIIRKLDLWMPHRLFSRAGRRALKGLFLNFKAYRSAHLHMPLRTETLEQ